MLIYDIEIIKAIPDKKSPRLANVEYCEGWNDHENMGVSVVGAYDYTEDRYRVFTADNMDEFVSLTLTENILIGFNNISFDNKVLRKNGADLDDSRCYDILVEIWRAAELGLTFAYPSHIGFGLDDCCKANFNRSKSGNGAYAPVDWQRGNIGTVIDYCLTDVWLTKKLMDRIIRLGKLKNPKDGSWLNMRSIQWTNS